MKRTVRVGLTTYRAVDGRHRLAQAGDVVDVHPEFVERFDQFNVLAGETVGEVEKLVTEPATPTEYSAPGAMDMVPGAPEIPYAEGPAPEPVDADEPEQVAEEKPAPKRAGSRARS